MTRRMGGVSLREYRSRGPDGVSSVDPAGPFRNVADPCPSGRRSRVGDPAFKVRHGWGDPRIREG